MSSELTTREVMEAVEFTASILERRHAYRIGERVHIPLGQGWSIAISADDAARLRIEACIRGTTRGILWCDPCDRARLAEVARVVRELSDGMNAEELV
jgi:hypothetical protein